MSSFEGIRSRLVGKIFKNAFIQKLQLPSVGIAITPKLSAAVISVLAQDQANRQAIENTIYILPKFQHLPIPIWEQMDAVKIARNPFESSLHALTGSAPI